MQYEYYILFGIFFSSKMYNVINSKQRVHLMKAPTLRRQSSGNRFRSHGPNSLSQASGKNQRKPRKITKFATVVFMSTRTNNTSSGQDRKKSMSMDEDNRTDDRLFSCPTPPIRDVHSLSCFIIPRCGLCVP